MLASISVLAAGFLLGLRHATDPDHVVAVTTIVSHKRSLRSAGLVGAAWGVGHTLTVLVVGGVIILFRVSISARVEMALEMGVALMLIALGIANVSAPPGPTPDSRSRAVLVGVVHGLAGSVAVALLILTLIDSVTLAMGYLIVFGIGTILGMMLMTVAIAIPSLLAVQGLANAGRYLRLGSGAVSIAFGVLLAHRIGFENGLFTGQIP